MKKVQMHTVGFIALAAAALMAGWMLIAPDEALANHPVLVEGEQDFDGDGLVGAAEDNDNATDRVFGTLTAALAAANGGANQNGRVVIVTSGRFPEAITITAANGNVSLEAAPGVEANIDAVLAGAAGNAARQAQPGITVNAAANRYVTIRNIVSRNWTVGILVTGGSRVAIDNCRLDSNVNYGIRVQDNARVAISHTSVNGSGLRAAPGVDNTPNPGIGIRFENLSSGSILASTVSGSVLTGIQNDSGSAGGVRLINVNAFDNAPDLAGVFR
jgi:hypothetical protein